MTDLPPPASWSPGFPPPGSGLPAPSAGTISPYPAGGPTFLRATWSVCGASLPEPSLERFPIYFLRPAEVSGLMVPANELHTMNTTTAEGIHDPTLIAELIEHRATQNHIAWVMFYTSTGNGMLHGTLGFSFTDSTTYLCRSADGLSQVTFQASDIRVILNNTIFLR